MGILGKKVIIIGAGSGIGRAAAIAIANGGASVVLAGRRREALEETAALLDTSATIHVVDAANEADVERFFNAIGTFDHLVSTIGQGIAGPVTTLRAADIQRAMEAKLWAPIPS